MQSELYCVLMFILDNTSSGSEETKESSDLVSEDFSKIIFFCQSHDLDKFALWSSGGSFGRALTCRPVGHGFKQSSCHTVMNSCVVETATGCPPFN